MGGCFEFRGSANLETTSSIPAVINKSRDDGYTCDFSTSGITLRAPSTRPHLRHYTTSTNLDAREGYWMDGWKWVVTFDIFVLLEYIMNAAYMLLSEPPPIYFLPRDILMRLSEAGLNFTIK